MYLFVLSWVYSETNYKKYKTQLNDPSNYIDKANVKKYNCYYF